jgi:hypothetical protein
MQPGKHAYTGKHSTFPHYGCHSYFCRYLGALTNNGRKLANFAGFYKGIQSAGAAIIWRLDALKKPFMGLFISGWVLLSGSLILALPLILFKITEHTDIEEDLKFSDETLADVAPQADLAARKAVVEHKA